jgi:hypothetical protein
MSACQSVALAPPAFGQSEQSQSERLLGQASGHEADELVRPAAPVQEPVHEPVELYPLPFCLFPL